MYLLKYINLKFVIIILYKNTTITLINLYTIYLLVTVMRRKMEGKGGW